MKLLVGQKIEHSVFGKGVVEQVIKRKIGKVQTDLYDPTEVECDLIYVKFADGSVKKFNENSIEPFIIKGGK